jgi:lipid-A-disaccharide synthase
MIALEAPARVLIVAGEASGDVYGGLLMRAMAASGPEGANGSSTGTVEFTGAGGPAMRDAGLRPLADASALGVTGVLEVLGRFLAIWKAYRRSCAVLHEAGRRPDLAILIDYPDFNLRLAAQARRAGVPVLYFISPQVWAWRQGRVRRMARIVDRLLVILPFEEEIYRRAGVPVDFIGHPLLDLVRTQRTRRQERSVLGLDPDRPLIALLPGSRRNEMKSHLGPLLEAAARLTGEFHDLQCLLVVAPTFDRREVADLVAAESPSSGVRPVLVSEDRYDAVASADAAIVASGTATLETALLGVPMVVVYRMNPVTFALARRLMRLQDIGMPNLIAGRRVVPELVQADCTGPSIAREVRRLLTDRAAAEQMRRDLAEVRDRLGRSGAIPRAARSAWSMIRAARRTRVA